MSVIKKTNILKLSLGMLSFGEKMSGTKLKLM